MSDTLRALDDAIRDHAAASGVLYDDGEVLVTWCAIAGVRRHDGSGPAIIIRSGDEMPDWELRGLLTEALAHLDRRRGND